MDTIPIPAGHIYSFQADNTLVDEVLEIAKQEEWVQNSQNKSSVSDNVFHEGLFDWLDACIDATAKSLLIPDSVKLPITSCWVNKSTKMQAHHHHAHPNSFLSGILYLTNNTDSQTVFHREESMWFENFEWASVFRSINTHKQGVYFTPTKGTLLLFPSKLKHHVKVMRNDEIRYTLSFNTFITGSFDSDGSEKSRLNLHAESLRERLKK